MAPFVLPVAAGVALLGGGLAALRYRALHKNDAAKPIIPKGPVAEEAIPRGKVVPPNLPVITAEQFKAQNDAAKKDIRDMALQGIVTLTGANGALFLDTPLADAVDSTGDGGLSMVQGEDLTRDGLMMSVNAELARKFGVSLGAVTSGNALFHALEVNGSRKAGITRAVSADLRIPGLVVDVPFKAVVGVGDA